MIYWLTTTSLRAAISNCESNPGYRVFVEPIPVCSEADILLTVRRYGCDAPAESVEYDDSSYIHISFGNNSVIEIGRIRHAKATAIPYDMMLIAQLNHSTITKVMGAYDKDGHVGPPAWMASDDKISSYSHIMSCLQCQQTILDSEFIYYLWEDKHNTYIDYFCNHLLPGETFGGGVLRTFITPDDHKTLGEERTISLKAFEKHCKTCKLFNISLPYE